MKIITRFLGRRFFWNFMLVLAVVCSIIYMISFMQDIATEPTFMDALEKSFSKFLELFTMFLPPTIFLGTLITFYKLTVSSEIIILQASGMSYFKIMRPMILVTLLVGIITTTIINPLIAKYNSIDLRDSQIERIDNAVWIREKTTNGDLTIRSNNMEYKKSGDLVFIKGTAILQNANHQMIKRIDADKIILTDSKFIAKNARILNFQGIERFLDWEFPTTISAKNIIRQYLKPNQTSFWELPTLIKVLEKSGAQSQAHLITFFTLLFLPLVLMSQTILGVMFSQTKDRRKFSFVKKFGFGIMTCFIVYFTIQTFNAIGSSGAISPILAVFLPPAIVTFFANAIISRHSNM